MNKELIYYKEIPDQELYSGDSFTVICIEKYKLLILPKKVTLWKGTIGIIGTFILTERSYVQIVVSDEENWFATSVVGSIYHNHAIIKFNDKRRKSIEI